MVVADEDKKTAAGGIDPVISVVIPIYAEEQTLPVLRRRLIAALEEQGNSFEVLFVDDGSRDGSLALLRAYHQEDPRIKVLSLSRNFGHQVAISCGIDFARGEGVILMDGDLQDPPEVLAGMVSRWREGYDVVYAVRQKRKEGLLKRTAYRSFYWLLQRVSYLNIPLDSGDFSLLDRRLVDLLKQMPERNGFFRGLRTWCG